MTGRSKEKKFEKPYCACIEDSLEARHAQQQGKKCEKARDIWGDVAGCLAWMAVVQGRRQLRKPQVHSGQVVKRFGLFGWVLAPPATGSPFASRSSPYAGEPHLDVETVAECWGLSFTTTSFSLPLPIITFIC